MDKENKEDILKAGKISIEVKKYARSFIKKDMKLLDIAEKIEAKIVELGGEVAFPTNLSIDEIAAHYTPSHDDENVARGLLKVDLGVHVDGWVSDTAFSLVLENNEENKKLIEAAEVGLSNALEKVNPGISLSEIGKIVEDTINEKGFSVVINLSGHSMDEYDLHAGLTIPNINNGSNEILGEGLFAIEPFATNGNGKVNDGKPSGIYALIDPKNIRSPIARELLEYIAEEYVNLPFCSRWLVKKFGTKALFGLKQLENNGNLHHFAQLVESGKGKVAQAEHSILVEKDGVVVTSRD